MKQLIAIAAGGAVGALLRYGMSNAVYADAGADHFPMARWQSMFWARF